MSYFIFHRGRGGDDPLNVGVSEPRHYIDPQYASELVYGRERFVSQETLARYLALRNMGLAGVEDVQLPKFVAGGVWGTPEAAAAALEKKTDRRKLGLEYTDADQERAYVEGHQVAAKLRAESENDFRRVLVELSRRGFIPVYDPPRVRKFGVLEGREKDGVIEGANRLGEIYRSLGEQQADKGVAEVVEGVRIERVSGRGDEIAAYIKLGRETFVETQGRPSKNQAEAIEGEFNTAAVAAAVADARIELYLAQDGAEAVGFMKLWKEDYGGDEEALRVEKLQILRRGQRRGLGRGLMAVAEAVARENGKRRLVLGAYAKNVGARDFQVKMGFRESGTEDFRMGKRVIQNAYFVKDLAGAAAAAGAIPAEGIPAFPLLNSQESLTRDTFLEFVAAWKDTVTTTPKRGRELVKFEPRGLQLGDAASATPTQIELDQRRDADLNGVADYFTEACRIQCRKEGERSLEDQWREEIAGGLAVGRKSPKTLRRQMYKKQGAAVCSNFNIAVALNVLAMFRPRAWLDISAGWGDRLAAAIAWSRISGGEFRRYLATDPNRCLQEGYRAMIDTLAADEERGTSMYRVVADGFVEADLGPDGEFDLVFSSPPFFSVEAQSSAEGDTLTRFPEIGAWKTGFLFPMLAKALRMLEAGGHLVLQIEDRPEYPYVEEMKAKAVELGFEDRGSVQQQYPDEAFGKYQRRPRELFVFRKPAVAAAAVVEVPPMEVAAAATYGFVDRDYRRPGRPLGKNRQELREQIEGAVLRGVEAVPAEDRVAVLLMGHPGAGKSGGLGARLVEVLAERGVVSARTRENVVRIDPDFVKTQMPDQKASFDLKRAEGDPEGVVLVSKRQDKATQYLPFVDALQSEALKTGRAVLLEAVCSGVDICIGRLREARAAGQRVVLGVVHRDDADGVWADIQRRAAETGRYVGEEYFRRTHAGNLENYRAIAESGLVDYTAVMRVRGDGTESVAVGRGVTDPDVVDVAVEAAAEPDKGGLRTMVERVRVGDGTECYVDLGSGFAFNVVTGDQLGFQDRGGNRILQDIRHSGIEGMDVGFGDAGAGAGTGTAMAAPAEPEKRQFIIVRLRRMTLRDDSEAMFVEYFFKLNDDRGVFDMLEEGDLPEWAATGTRVELGENLTAIFMPEMSGRETSLPRYSRRALAEGGIWGVLDDLTPRGEIKLEGVAGRVGIQNFPIAESLIQVIRATRGRIEEELGVVGAAAAGAAAAGGRVLREPLSLYHGTANETIAIIAGKNAPLRETADDGKSMLGPAVQLGSFQKATRFAARGQSARDMRAGSIVRTQGFPTRMLEQPEPGRLQRRPGESAKDFAFRDIADHEAEWKKRGQDAVHVRASERSQGTTEAGKKIMPLRNGEWAMVAGIVENTSQAPIDMDTVEAGDYNPLQRDQAIVS